MWKGVELKKMKRLTHEEVKKQLIESFVINEVVETDELNKQADKQKKFKALRKLQRWFKSTKTSLEKKAAKMIRKYENIIRTKKKGIINIAFHQGKVFKKFKDKEKFITLVSQLGIHKTTIIFKINIYKLCEKLLKSSIGLGFLKNHFKDILEICSENAQ